MGGVPVRVQSSTGTMMERISSGENLIGYNVLGPTPWCAPRPTRRSAWPAQGLQPGPVAREFINKAGKNVNAAKLWLDYMLSSVARPSSPTMPSCSPSAPT
jgi:iron(III) transport system substrate-binding protein